MSFSYPNAGIAIINGKDFYRIKADALNLTGGNTPSVGVADLIPIDVGFAGISVGPESDFDKYELFYPDPVAPGNYQRIEFSSAHPLIARFDVSNFEESPDTDGEKAKAFVRPLGIAARDFSSGDLINAISDIVVYTRNAPSQIATKRAPKISEGFPRLYSASFNYFYIPCFGRRYLGAHAFVSGFPLPVATMEVIGLRSYLPLTFSVSDTGQASSFVTEVQLLAPASLPAGGVEAESFGYDCVTGGKGFFDFLMVKIATDQNAVPSDYFLGAPGSQGFHLIMEARD